ncbi:hypothetical protein BC938DRAFT_473813 [Jimgerdemannia flammicorona]|uniref:Uncharacterized protein n=1 Tax=Jimgerdemannia flammicorona TaxID=994334 RepID=A0A433Q3E4_9FUNG|nr:hypothetical protein BC938DRAFT_473813 [Jimgerdemannia flammicorona]
MYLSVESQSAFPYPAFRDHVVPYHSSSFTMIQPHPYQPQLASYSQSSAIAAAQQAQVAAAAASQQPQNPTTALPPQPNTVPASSQQAPHNPPHAAQQAAAAGTAGSTSKPSSQAPPQTGEPAPNANSTSGGTPVNIPQLADFASAMVFAMWHARRPSLAVLYNSSSPPPTSPINSGAGSPTSATPTPVQHRQSVSMATNASPAFKKFCLQVSCFRGSWDADDVTC